MTLTTLIYELEEIANKYPGDDPDVISSPQIPLKSISAGWGNNIAAVDSVGTKIVLVTTPRE